MTWFAILCGCAPEGYRQKKLVGMHNFLVSEEDGSVPEKNIVVFPSGVNELMLEFALNNILEGNTDDEVCGILLYICAVAMSDLESKLSYVDCDVVRLGRDEIRKDVIEHYAKLFAENEIDFQVMYDCDREMVSEDVLGWEKVAN